MNDISSKKVLAGYDAYELYKKKVHEWNKWAEDNAGATVIFEGFEFEEECDFSGFKFPGLVNFEDAIFPKKVKFKDALFLDCVCFGRAKFLDDANFTRAVFKKKAKFEKVKFNKKVNFRYAMFCGTTIFEGGEFKYKERAADFFESSFKKSLRLGGAKFLREPDFRSTMLSLGVGLYDIEVTYQTKRRHNWKKGFESFIKGSIKSLRQGLLFWGWTLLYWSKLVLFWGQALHKGDSDKYRRLKDLAAAANDHEAEQLFFAHELKAKRFYKTKRLKLIPNYLFAWSCGYGRNIALPIGGLTSVWLFFSGFYFYLSENPDLNAKYTQALLLSGSHILPVIGGTKEIRKEAIKELGFGDNVHIVYSSAFIEGILSIVFLFLIGLTLRNRFRL